MGSDGEASDLNLPVYVAVGSNVKEGKSLLNWAAENFQGRDICLVHVHRPANLLSLCKPTASLQFHVCLCECNSDFY